jgi:cell fate (sporulation/competence/biofilm development) regulator YlbF (YheA/YmcA/DUF963 family)
VNGIEKFPIGDLFVLDAYHLHHFYHRLDLTMMQMMQMIMIKNCSSTGKYTMPFTLEIRQAAENLGKQLGADPSVHEFIRIEQEIQQDGKVVELETKLAQLNQKLGEHEQTGGRLDRTIVEEYYELKGQVENHPLITARDYQLEYVKALFAQTAQHITAVLGIDYAALASQAEE